LVPPSLDSLFLSSTCCDSSTCCLLPRSVTLSHLAACITNLIMIYFSLIRVSYSGRRRLLKICTVQTQLEVYNRPTTVTCCTFKMSHALHVPEPLIVTVLGHLTCSTSFSRMLSHDFKVSAITALPRTACTCLQRDSALGATIASVRVTYKINS